MGCHGGRQAFSSGAVPQRGPEQFTVVLHWQAGLKK
jgi:hypothetical protein